METTIKVFVPDIASPAQDKISFAFSDVSINDLPNVLDALRRTLANAYMNALPRTGAYSERVSIVREFILANNESTCQVDTKAS